MRCGQELIALMSSQKPPGYFLKPMLHYMFTNLNFKKKKKITMVLLPQRTKTGAHQQSVGLWNLKEVAVLCNCGQTLPTSGLPH